MPGPSSPGFASAVAAVSALEPVAAAPRRRGRASNGRFARESPGTRAAAVAMACGGRRSGAGDVRRVSCWPASRQPAPTAGLTAVAPATDARGHRRQSCMLAEQHYQNAITGLERIASAEKGSLDPQTASTLEKNLAGRRSGHRREPRGAQSAARQRAGAAEPARELQGQDRAAAGHRWR